MILHFYYWGTNQFIVQRALSATTDKEAKMGIIAAGFFKLLIPFFSIGTESPLTISSKTVTWMSSGCVFIKLMTELISPLGFGLVGLIAAGMIGAILSSLDSMMNSAATIMTFDLYKKYINPEADDRKLIRMGRFWIFAFIILAGLITIFTMDPNSKDSFFLEVAKHQGNLIAGVVVAFFIGMLEGATAAGGVAAILPESSSVTRFQFFILIWQKETRNLSIFLERSLFYAWCLSSAILSTLVHIIISLKTQPDEEKGKLTGMA